MLGALEASESASKKRKKRALEREVELIERARRKEEGEARQGADQVAARRTAAVTFQRPQHECFPGE